MWFAADKFTMACHAAGKQYRRINDDLFGDVDVRTFLDHPAGHRAADDQQQSPGSAVIPLWAVEADDEGDEIKAKRQHPKKRNRCDIDA